MVGIRVFSNAVITTEIKTPLNIRMRAFSFFLSFKFDFLSFVLNMKHFMPSGFHVFLFSVSLTPGHYVSSSCPPSDCFSASVMRMSRSRSDIQLQSEKMRPSCICSHPSCLCCPFHWLPRKSLLSPCSCFMLVFCSLRGIDMYISLPS